MCVGMCCVDVLCVVHVTTVVRAFSINNVDQHRRDHGIIK